MARDDSPPDVVGEPRAGLTIWIIISASLFSAAIALFVAWFVIIRPEAAKRTDTVSVDRFLSGSPNGSTGSATADVAKGQPVPNVTFQRLDGAGTITLAGLLGKPLVLNFWASSCTPCLTEMPLLEHAHATYGDRVTFLGIDTSEGVDAGRAMVRRTGVTYDQASDPQGEHVTHFGAVQLPNTVIVDANGKVTEIHNRAFHDDAELKASIDAALATAK